MKISWSLYDKLKSKKDKFQNDRLIDFYGMSTQRQFNLDVSKSRLLYIYIHILWAIVFKNFFGTMFNRI